MTSVVTIGFQASPVKAAAPHPDPILEILETVSAIEGVAVCDPGQVTKEEVGYNGIIATNLTGDRCLIAYGIYHTNDFPNLNVPGAYQNLIGVDWDIVPAYGKSRLLVVLGFKEHCKVQKDLTSSPPGTDLKVLYPDILRGNNQELQGQRLVWADNKGSIDCRREVTPTPTSSPTPTRTATPTATSSPTPPMTIVIEMPSPTPSATPTSPRPTGTPSTEAPPATNTPKPPTTVPATSVPGVTPTPIAPITGGAIPGGYVTANTLMLVLLALLLGGFLTGMGFKLASRR